MTNNKIITGALFGAIGGLAGTYLMTWYNRAVAGIVGHDPLMQTREDESGALDDISISGMQAEENESATEALGRVAQEAATGREPDEHEKQRLSQGIHWGYGTAVSALYGAVRGRRGGADITGGLMFGTALWAIGDELMVPLLGLSKGPTAYPVEQHAQRLGMHLFYGVVAAATTQILFAVTTSRSRKSNVVMQAARTWATWKVLKTAGKKLSTPGKAGRGITKDARRISRDLRRTATEGVRSVTGAAGRSGRQAGLLRRGKNGLISRALA